MADAAADLVDFISAAKTLAILTGAGVSTASGIPDYRDRDGNWKHTQPMSFAEFVARPAARQRYWARSMAGWRRFGHAEPCDAHRALARLEQLGRVDTLVTQNVDGLHQRAGSANVIDLHGRLDTVRCLECGLATSRSEWQSLLQDNNKAFDGPVRSIRPDGDVELDDTDHQHFLVPACDACGGIMKPNVVFFGEAVPRERVAGALAAVERASSLLVIGTSLMVYSGLRFVRYAAALGKPVAIVNQGRTRGDEHALLKLNADCGEVLASTVGRLAMRDDAVSSR